MFRTSFGIEMLHRARRRARLKAAARKRLLRQRTRLDNISKRNAIRSPLLRLPAEVRNLVYHYVFCDEVAKLDEDSWYCYQVAVWKFFPDNCLKLLHVSRQVYQETALLPYRLATFQFGLSGTGVHGNKRNAIKEFLDMRSEVQIEVLGNLELCSYYSGGFEGVKLSGTGAYWVARLSKRDSIRMMTQEKLLH